MILNGAKEHKLQKRLEQISNLIPQLSSEFVSKIRHFGIMSSKLNDVSVVKKHRSFSSDDQ